MNLKNIIRKVDITENIVQSFTGDQLFLINKTFAGIQHHVLDSFGFDNPNLTTNDIVDEIFNISTDFEAGVASFETSPFKRNINPRHKKISQTI